MTRDDHLRILAELRQERDRHSEKERLAVLAARRDGLSWGEIAQALNVGRSGLWKRYHPLEEDG